MMPADNASKIRRPTRSTTAVGISILINLYLYFTHSMQVKSNEANFYEGLKSLESKHGGKCCFPMSADTVNTLSCHVIPIRKSM